MEHMYYFVRILLTWLLCLLSVLLHELGHALGYRISTGKAKWKVIAGSGPRMIGTSKYIFCLIPAGGYFIPGEEPTPWFLCCRPSCTVSFVSAFWSLFRLGAAFTKYCFRYSPSFCISTSFSLSLLSFRFATESYAGDSKATVCRSFIC